MNKIVQIGDKKIGDGEKVFIVVELGVCHEQNIQLAQHFIEVAKKVGADAVKVESFQADELVVDKNIEHEYGTIKGVRRENYYRLLKRLELSYDDYAILKKKADEVGILFFATVHNKYSVDFMHNIDVCAFKTSSPDVINYPLLRYIATKGFPLFMDTGGAFIGEIEKAIIMLEKEGLKDVILMHNPSGYPAPPERTDLKMIQTIKNLTDVPVGLSCHTPGFDMVVASIALGANVIEKPISRNKEIEGPEYIFSFLDTEAEKFVDKIRTTEISLGEKRRMTVSEMSLPRFIGRRGTYAAKDLDEGDVISEENILLAKPCKGISVEFFDEVIGKTLRKPKKKHAPICWGDLE